MNRVILMGRLTRDPEVRYSAGENPIAVARFTLAIDRKKDNEQTADFIGCVCFGKVAERIEKYVSQGMKILVEGSWQTGSYTNKDGNKVYTNDCNVYNFYFCESKAQAQQNKPQPSVSSDGFMNIPDGLEDGGLPFN